MIRREQAVSGLGVGIAEPSSRETELERVRAALQGIRFGEVRLIIQDGAIVQIERVEKERLR
jgi:hypothetical protein